MDDFFKTYKKAKPVLGIPNFEMNRPIVHPNTLAEIGIELEIEGRNLPSAGHFGEVVGKKSNAFWDRKEDGSLRGGWEYVLSSPCYASEVEDMVTGLYNGFTSRAGVNLLLSNRCSTHVHLNVGGYKVNEITSFLGLWFTFEEVLIKWCGEERTTNHFCLSHKDTSDIVDAWFTFLSTGSRRFRNLKYSAINILTMDSFGSLEIRCGPASETPDTIIKWVKLLKGMQDYSRKVFQCPTSIAHALSERGAEEIFKEICEEGGLPLSFLEEIMSLTDTTNHFNNLCMDGFRAFQKNILGFDWESWMVEINKEYVPDPFNSKTRKSIRREIPEDIIRMEDINRMLNTTQTRIRLREAVNNPRVWNGE